MYPPRIAFANCGHKLCKLYLIWNKLVVVNLLLLNMDPRWRQWKWLAQTLSQTLLGQRRKRECLGTRLGRNYWALDPIGLNPLDTIWILHNVVFFIAFTLHLFEISKSREISAQQMFLKVWVSSTFKEEKKQKSVCKYWIPEGGDSNPLPMPLRHWGLGGEKWFDLKLYSNNPNPK